ncbi:hypothetical protein BAGA_05460 [Bacillus gaemokensis]|uniref:Uncharacterized protein n=2 Tax=Bacillus gaemokensis TaxID=574375 RepID=A0A073K9D0_9BACI|nr:hypothetical protein BAGA_05460 [Bacillus gaemokensis]KYG38161.1 hypothetical protein AZF08_20495 [Bacillus gaemokensis]
MTKPRKVDTEKVQLCYYCTNVIEDLGDLVFRKVPLATPKGIFQKNRQFHLKCLIEYNDKLENLELRQEENSDWDLVYRYFQVDILGLSKTQNLDKHAVSRLLGLRVGKYIPNGTNTRTLPRGYDFKIILTTLKVVKPKVKAYMATATLANDKHRIDGIMRFVTSEINDVAKRMETQRKSNEKLVKEEVKEEFDYMKLLAERKQAEVEVEEDEDLDTTIEALLGGN